MTDLFRLIDFITEPTNILLIGLSAGIITMLLTRGFLWLIGVKGKAAGYIPMAVGILTVIVVEVIFWSFYIWYNTPLGEHLDLRT